MTAKIMSAMTCAIGVALLAPAASGQIQFRDQTTLRFPNGPHEWTNQVALADVDGDGDIDIAFANGGNFNTAGPQLKVRLYINDGTATFTDETDARTGGITGHFRGVEFGDVDDDGDLDMILANDFNKPPRLLINDGNGFFTDETASRLPLINLSSARGQFIDIDNDGDLDLYFVNGGSVNRFGCGLSKIYINDGDGFFTDETADRHPPGCISGPMDAKIGDLTGDFWLDIRVGALGSNNSRLFINNGDGTLANLSANVPPDSTCYAYDFGDINGNGRMDMIGINAGPGSTDLLLRNDGNAMFTNISGQLSTNPSVDDNDSKFFDFNGDGILDLVIGRLYGAAERLYENDGNGNFTEITGIISANGDPTLDIVVGDLNGNGKFDIVTGQGETNQQSLLVNRLYINIGPEDTFPPVVVDTEQLDDTEDLDGPYVVRAAITDQMTNDRNFFDKGIFLSYSVNGGPDQQVPMRWSGGQIYRAEIPGQPGGGTVEYFVTAIDFNDNEGTGETLAFTVIGGKEPDCPGDLNGDNVVNVSDLLDMLGQFGDCPGCDADLNGDDVVNVSDLLALLGVFGPCP